MTDREHDERYEVEDADRKRALRTLAALIDEEIPDGCGFTLFLFDYGAGGSMFYISSAERESSVAAIKEWIAKQEGK